MLARMLRTLLGVLCVAAAGWLWIGLQRGWPVWLVVGGAVLLLAPMLPALLLEFGLLALAGGDARWPPPPAAGWLRALRGELWAATRVFAWDQAFAARRQPDVPPRPGRTGVLLVHGYSCNRGLWRRWLARLAAQGVPCTAIDGEPVFGRIDDWVPAIDAAARALAQGCGRPPIVVAHSMGGLAVRAWLGGRPAGLPVRHVVTIGSPHQGTWLARLGHTANGRQMRQGSPWLQALARGEAAGLAVPFTCFFGHADNIVFPASTATLPGADNRHLNDVAHLAMVEHPAVWAEVQRLLALADAAADAAAEADAADAAAAGAAAADATAAPAARP